jgi:hypothetical protein
MNFKEFLTESKEDVEHKILLKSEHLEDNFI